MAQGDRGSGFNSEWQHEGTSVMLEDVTVQIIGAGLAGCEAALQCAKHGVSARLHEMRPDVQTEAHRTGDVAELVCSNSLKSTEPGNAHGLLKAELGIYGCVLLECTERTRIPGGKALVVDRQRFSAEVQSALDDAGIEVVREEIKEIPDKLAIVASGPLTSPELADSLTGLLGVKRLFFYDAIAPIVAADSIDMNVAFAASRYGVGQDYLNCPLTREQYDRLVNELLEAELHPMKDFEERCLFEPCLPVEELARRGKETLAFGPMKPVGLVDPKTGKRPFAVVQLRKENAEGTMFNLVGFQTRLKRSEQKRLFRMIPGLDKAEFLRFGSMHRNTYLHGPEVLLPTLQTKVRPDLFVAGQLTGVEGYVESIAAGLVAGINAARFCKSEDLVQFPEQTMLGGLLKYITTPNQEFQPMNANFGLVPVLKQKARGKEKRRLLAERALEAAGQDRSHLNGDEI